MAVSGSLPFGPLDDTDALCSSSDETHDALMTLYRNLFAKQIETAESEEILAVWR